MKKLGIIIIISTLLISFSAFVMSYGITSKAIENNSDETESNAGITSNVQNSANANRLTDEQIRKIVTANNRIKTEIKSGECPEKCTCTGSAVKCQLNNGTREMTIVAGKSGNIIVQIKGVNASTNVTLYKSNKTIYGVFKNNETKRVRLLPDQVQERIRERLKRALENENISLNEDGTYQYNAENKARLFLLFPVKVAVNAEVNSETGEIVKIKKSWWAFMARDESQQIVGAGCGTVTPGENDNCCISKGYDFWNAAAGECGFNSE